MLIFMKSRPELKMGHVGLKLSLGFFLEKTYLHSRMHNFDPIFMKLCPNVDLYEIYTRIKNAPCVLLSSPGISPEEVMHYPQHRV